MRLFIKDKSHIKPPSGKTTRHWEEIGQLALIAIAYWATIRFGLLLVVRTEGIASIWPASGLTLAILLLKPKRQWAKLLAVFFVITAAGDWSGGYSLPVSLGFALADTLEPLLGAWALIYFCKSKITFKRTVEIFALFGVAILSNGITALLGAAVPALAFSVPFLNTWSLWWIANGLGIILVTPVIVTWATSQNVVQPASPRRLVETVLFVLVLAMFAWLLFGPFTVAEKPLLRNYMLIPLLIWLAFRFSPRGMAGALLLFATIAVWNSLQGYGIFAFLHQTQTEHLISLQMFLIVAAFSGLLMSAMVTENKRAETERQVLLDITQGLVATKDLQGFLSLVHNSIAKVIYAENFFVILYNKDTALFEEVYSVDKFDLPADPSRLEKSLSAHIFRSGQPFLSTQAGFDKLVRQGKVELVGTNSPSWLGVPLKTSSETIGVMVTQDYDKSDRYSERDMNFLASIARQVAMVIERKQAEEKIARMALMLDIAPNAITVHDFDGRFIYANQRTFDLHGYDPDEFMSLNLSELDVPDSASLIAPRMQELLDRGEATFQVEHLMKDGSLLPLEVYARLTTWGNIKSILSIATDITDRRQAEEKLITIMKAIESTSDAVGISDAQGRHIYQNKAITDLFEYATAEEMEAAGGGSIVVKDPQVAKEMFGNIKSGKSWSGELEMVTKSGRVFPAYERADAIRDSAGNIIGLIGIITDITERKQAEATLRDSEEKFRKAFTISPDSININRMHDGMYVAINNGFTQIMGYTPEECIGKTSIELNIWDRLEDRQTLVEDLIKHGEVANLEARFRAKNGDIKYGLMSASVLELNSVRHIISITRDITERKRAEDEILEKSKELEALFTISSHLRTATTANDMLPVVLTQMSKVLNADANAVILLDPDQTHFTYVIGGGLLASNTGLQFDVKNSISGHTLQTRQPYITLDFANDLLRSSAIRNSEGIGPMVVVPLQSESEFIGTLLCARAKDSHTGPFTTAEVQLLVSIGEMVGNALRRARLYDDALSRLQRVQGLRSIDSFINANMNIKTTLNLLVNQAISLMNVDAAAILLYNPYLHMLENTTAYGFHYKDIEKTRIELDNEYTGRAILERRIITVSDLSNIQDSVHKEMMEKEGFVACFMTPMIAKGKVLGILELYNRTDLHPNQEWLDFLEALGAQAAIAIDNSNLFRDLQTSNLELTLAYDATIQGWSQALDLKDRETEGHTLRVTEATIGIAKLAGLSENEIMHIRRGALLHDIGKMGIPDQILNKTGKLTPKEWFIMRQHPQYAYDMLHPIEFLRPALDIPYYHHERWDGTGYPQGLQNLKIPFAARLFAVADVWDAVTHDRIYRKAWSKKKALAHIQEQSGRHFDPQVVDLFLKFSRTTASRKK